MLILGPDDPFPHGTRRIAVAGTSGSGKTTLASRMAVLLGLEFTEIDGLYHGPAWEPREEFLPDVQRVLATDAWAIEWQYGLARPLILERAEVLVWLDLPVRTVMTQVVRRTLRRRWRREILWNGNVEPPLTDIFMKDRDNIIRWAWNTRHKLDDLDRFVEERAPHLMLVRLRSRAEVETWVRTVQSTVQRGGWRET